jgi:hypothetical protein
MTEDCSGTAPVRPSSITISQILDEDFHRDGIIDPIDEFT